MQSENKSGTLNLSKLLIIALSTVCSITVISISFQKGNPYIVQNLLYIPIIAACIWYTRLGFLYSVLLSAAYFGLSYLYFNHDFILKPELRSGAVIRTVFFICIAGMTAGLSCLRRKSEARVFESKNLLQAVLDAIPMSVYWKNKDGTFAGGNPFFLANCAKMSMEELIGKKDSHLECGASAARGAADDAHVLSSGTPLTGYEDVCFDADGNQRRILTSKIPLRNSEGNIYGVLGFCSDITAQKIEQKKAEIKTLLIDYAVSHSVDELMQYALDYITEASSSEIGFFHFLADDQKTLTLQEWSTATKARFCKAEGKGSHYSVDAAGVWVDCIQERRPVIHNDYKSLAHKKGLPAGHAEVIRILTVPVLRNKKITAILGVGNKPMIYTRHDLDLVNFLADAAWTIIEQKKSEGALIAAKNAAEEANKAKSQFLAHMSHEIRTPLNGVIGFTELLQNTPLSPVQEEYVRNANISGHNLLEIINDVLDFSKIEAGMMELHPEKTDMPLLLEQSTGIISHSAERKKLAVLSVIDPVMPRFALVDPMRLKQIIANLLSNAVKFTSQGTITLRADYKNGAAGHGLFTISVSDTGIGITGEQRAKLFTSFSQADSATTRKFGGTGLGLVISSMIAQKMNSGITLESTPGKGSVFSFTISAEIFSDDGSEQDIKNKKPSCPAHADTGTLNVKSPRNIQDIKILIAEDSALNLALIRAILGGLAPHAQILEAKDGREAVSLWETHAPEIILMDIQMPEVDGIEAARIIREKEQLSSAQRAHDKKKRTRIAALTAHALAEEKEKCIAAGMDGFLTKPIDKTALDMFLFPDTALSGE